MSMLFKPISFLLCSLLLACAASSADNTTKRSPSFRCDKAFTKVEKMICASDSLSRLDQVLSAEFQLVKFQKIDTTQWQPFLESQNFWLRERDRCQDIDCLQMSYKTRIKALMSMSENGVKKDFSNKKYTYRLKEGYQYQLCKDYEKFVNRAIESPKESCGLAYYFDDEARQHGFLHVNAWQEVDKAEYKNQIRQYWISAYSDSSVSWREKNLTEEEFQQFYNWVVKVWVNRFDINFDGINDTVMRLIIKSCMHSNFNYVVIDGEQDGLKWKDRDMFGGNIFLYQGRPYFALGGVSSVYELSGGGQYIHRQQVCQLQRLER